MIGPEGLWGWAPLGRLPWKARDIFDQIGKEAGRLPEDWPPLKATATLNRTRMPYRP
jgi:hypothetical protein